MADSQLHAVFLEREAKKVVIKLQWDSFSFIVNHMVTGNEEKV
jgi:hypothetical protein